MATGGKAKGVPWSKDAKAERKWKALKKRGYKPPKDDAERVQRLRETSHDRVCA